MTHVFFDDRNLQVFSVRSGGSTGVMVRGFTPDNCSTFRLDDQGHIITIKLSPDQKILAVQRSKQDVQFVGVASTGAQGILEDRQYSQAIKSKTATLLGFSWTAAHEIAYFTDAGVETYSVIHDRRMLKNLKSQAQITAWFTYCPRTSLVVVAPNLASSSLQLLAIKPGGHIYKLPKIEHENAEIRERDVSICHLYESRTYVGVILHPAGNSSELHLHFVTKEQTQVTKTHVLNVPAKGGLALNVLDNLFVLHHQSSSVSYIFDVDVSGDSDGTSTYLTPICSGKVIQAEASATQVATYSNNWVTFQPDVLVDAKLGQMWRIRIDLDNTILVQDIPDMCKLVSFLQQRERAKLVLLDAFLSLCKSSNTRIHTIGNAFDLLNKEYRAHLDKQMQNQLALSTSPFSALKSTPSDASSKITTKVIIDQADIYTHLFTSLSDDPDISLKRLNAILIEYFRSLADHKIPAQHFLNELLINVLVRQKLWFQLHQNLQYHVISDSKPIACLLLSLESAYPPAYQLALDMLHRLRNSKEEICEILLSKKKIMPALRYAQDNGLDHIPAKKFLEAAMLAEDDHLFYNVYTFYEEKNLIGKTGYELYTSYFQSKFSSEKPLADSCDSL